MFDFVHDEPLAGFDIREYLARGKRFIEKHAPPVPTTPEAMISALEAMIAEDDAWLSALRERFADCCAADLGHRFPDNVWDDGGPVVCEWRLVFCEAGDGFAPHLAIEPVQSCETENRTWDL